MRLHRGPSTPPLSQLLSSLMDVYCILWYVISANRKRLLSYLLQGCNPDTTFSVPECRPNISSVYTTTDAYKPGRMSSSSAPGAHVPNYESVSRSCNRSPGIAWHLGYSCVASRYSSNVVRTRTVVQPSISREGTHMSSGVDLNRSMDPPSTSSALADSGIPEYDVVRTNIQEKVLVANVPAVTSTDGFASRLPRNKLGSAPSVMSHPHGTIAP